MHQIHQISNCVPVSFAAHLSHFAARVVLGAKLQERERLEHLARVVLWPVLRQKESIILMHKHCSRKPFKS